MENKETKSQAEIQVAKMLEEGLKSGKYTKATITTNTGEVITVVEKNKETKRIFTREEERCLMNDSSLNGRKETTDKTPTAEEFWEQISPNEKHGVLAELKKIHLSNHVFEVMRRFTQLHLTKQAEVIYMQILEDDGSCTIKQSILQASEEYKQSVK
jgi:hypothetical protein